MTWTMQYLYSLSLLTTPKADILGSITSFSSTMKTLELLDLLDIY